MKTLRPGSWKDPRAKRWLARMAVVLALIWPGLARAVYAPIPEIEKGKALTTYFSGGVYYDSNVFGSPTDETGTMVYRLQPSMVFNAAVADRSFVSASYHLSLDYMPQRPGKQVIDSHEFSGRFAHTFTPQMEMDVSEDYQIARNPASLLPGLAGVANNVDQSYVRNQLDGRFSTSLTGRTGLLAKVRYSDFQYEDAGLANELDRSEWLGGLVLSHAILPSLKSTAEYRHLVINYRHGGMTKNKQSDFFLVGGDEILTERVALSGRVGAEYRRRQGEEDAVSPYAELGLKADYGKGSYVSVGYGYSIEETSDLNTYLDMGVNRFFVNVQHTLTPKLVAGGSVTWSPSTLNSRPGVGRDREETNTQAGLSLTYRPTASWSVVATVDGDRIHSQDISRNLKRTRGGVSANFAF